MTKDEKIKFKKEYDEAKQHFLYYYKPEFDRAYKQFASYTGDRAEYLEKTKDGEVWQSNVFIPQIFSYIKTFLQKTVGVTPDFTLEGEHSEPLKDVLTWLWEVGMSDDMVDYFLQCFITGNTIGKDFLKKEKITKREKQVNIVDQIKRLFVKDVLKGIVFRPDFDAVDIYNWYPHPRMKKISDNFPVFQRYVISLDEAREQYPDGKNFDSLKDKEGTDTADYASVRQEVLIKLYSSIRETTKASSTYSAGEPPKSDEKLLEIVERWTNDRKVVMAFVGGEAIEIEDRPNPNDHAEKPYFITKFFPRPFQLMAMGIPKLCENLQELLNSVVNQRNDAVTLGNLGLIAAAPTALPGYQGTSFKVGPMRILWTPDPRSVQRIKLGDVDQSLYMEADQIKEAMRVAVGIDEFSTTQNTTRKETATVASFMREATEEGVKLFLIMLRNSYIGHFQHFISMIQQHWTKRSVVPKKALAILDDYSDTDFDTQSENWIDAEGNHLLFPDEYEMTMEQASTLATSTELAKSKDMELWELVKDAPDEMIDPETGKVFSIKKFKVLQKLIEDYGWEKDSYVVEKKIEVMPQTVPGLPGASPDNNTPAQPLAGNMSGAELGAAMNI